MHTCHSIPYFIWMNQYYLQCVVIVISNLFVIVIVCHRSNTKDIDLEVCWSVPGPTQRSCVYHCIFIFFLSNVIITSYLLTILFQIIFLNYPIYTMFRQQGLIKGWLLISLRTDCYIIWLLLIFVLFILPGQQYKRFFRLETRTLLIISPTIPTQNDISPTGTEKL